MADETLMNGLNSPNNEFPPAVGAVANPAVNPEISAIAKHLASVAAGALAAHGLIASSGTDMVVQELGGLLIAGAMMTLSWLKTQKWVKAVEAAWLHIPVSNQASGSAAPWPIEHNSIETEMYNLVHAIEVAKNHSISSVVPGLVGKLEDLIETKYPGVAEAIEPKVNVVEKVVTTLDPAIRAQLVELQNVIQDRLAGKTPDETAKMPEVSGQSAVQQAEPAAANAQPPQVNAQQSQPLNGPTQAQLDANMKAQLDYEYQAKLAAAAQSQTTQGNPA